MGARWKPEDDAQLARLYECGTPLRMIAERLQRSPDAVTYRRHVLGIADRRARWTSTADAVIVAAAQARIPASAVAAHLGLSVDRVRRRRAQLTGARPAARRYSAAEDDELRSRWREADAEVLAREFGRSAEAIRLRARALGLHQPPRRSRWTEEEDDLVRDGYSAGLSCAQVAAGLPRPRTPGAVAARATKLGLSNYARRWTAREDRHLTALARAGVSLEQAAARLVRTPEALRRRARTLGIAPPRPGAHLRAGQPWTAAEDDLLRNHATAHPTALTGLLGRSDHAVRYRMRKLGLLPARGRTPHHTLPAIQGLTPGQRAIARTLEDSDPAYLLAAARRLRLSPGAVRREGAQRPDPTRRTRAA